MADLNVQNTPMVRCQWCGNDPDYVHYHDTEWGIPKLDDLALFEKISLEGAQAGLSWITILRKREGYRAAFEGFDPHKIVAKGKDHFMQHMDNPNIVRHRLKIESVYTNALAFIKIQEEFGSFAKYWWQWSDFKIIDLCPSKLEDVPSQTPLSVKISKDMKKRGFRFVGPSIIYSMMQATGMVNDHIASCSFRNHGKAVDSSMFGV